MKSIEVVCSYHHGNTEKVAERIAETLGARIAVPQQTAPEEFGGYDLVGFGSGIYDAKKSWSPKGAERPDRRPSYQASCRQSLSARIHC